MPRKKTAKAKKTKKLVELNQTDGMALPEPNEKYEPSTLDQVFGDDGVSRYKTLDEQVYGDVLNNMSKSDLKNEAVRVGLLPIDNVQQLRGRLLREFKVHVSSYRRPTLNNQASTEVSDEVRKILEEGK